MSQLLRDKYARQGVIDEDLATELKEVLLRDKDNQGDDNLVDEALSLLESDPSEFLQTYFLQYEDAARQPSHLLPADWGSVWSLTSK